MKGTQLSGVVSAPHVRAADPGAIVEASHSGPQWDVDLVLAGVDEEQLLTVDEVQLSSRPRDLAMVLFRQGIELSDQEYLTKQPRLP